MSYLSFLDDNLLRVSQSIGDAKEVFNYYEVGYWQFTHEELYILIENEQETGEKLRIVETKPGFFIESLNFGCDKWN